MRCAFAAHASTSRAIGDEARTGVDICDIFRMLDADCDGGLNVEELQTLSSRWATQAQADAAVEALLLRRGGNLEAVAADLAGDRSSVDPFRIRECLIVA